MDGTFLLWWFTAKNERGNDKRAWVCQFVESVYQIKYKDNYPNQFKNTYIIHTLPKNRRPADKNKTKQIFISIINMIELSYLFKFKH